MAALLNKPQIKIKVYFRLQIVFAENTSVCHNKSDEIKCWNTEHIMHLSKPDREYNF
jgi:hypothetical protein